MPVKLTLCGLVGSCGTETASVALSVVVVVGMNITPIVHDELPARDVPHVPPVIVKSDELAPLSALPIEIEYGE